MGGGSGGWVQFVGGYGVGDSLRLLGIERVTAYLKKSKLEIRGVTPCFSYLNRIAPYISNYYLL